MKIMWIFNTVKFIILEKFVFKLWYNKKSQVGSHVKYEYNWKQIIIPKHREISRWTLNKIFRTISSHLWLSKNDLELIFLQFYKKNKK